MFNRLWRNLIGSGSSAGRKRQYTARLGVEILEDRWMPSATSVAPPTISHMSNNNWTEGLSSFNGAMTITGGDAPYTIVKDANLPPGVTPVISGDTIGFTGTPDVAETFSNCSITIRDASGQTASKTFVIDVEPALIIGNVTQNQWTVEEQGYNGHMTIAGGVGSYSLVSASGLPTGLTAMVSGNTVEFYGVPTATGAFQSTVTVKDGDGATASETFTITINAQPTLTPLTALQWTAGTPGYTGTVTIQGGTGPYSIAAYAYLPFTATISGNVIYFTGTAPPREYVDSTFTVQDATGAQVSQTDTITVNPQVSFNGLSNSTWTVGQPGFNGVISFNDGYGTQPFIIVGYTGLPIGLTPVVNGGNITFTGTPTVAGSFGNGMLSMEDSGGQVFNVPANITINPPLTFSTTGLPDADDNVGYGASLHTTGGTGAVTYALTGGALPGGLILQANGHITGATPLSGTFSFTATATDSTGATATQTFTIAVAPAFSLGNLTLNQWTVNQSGFTGAILINGGNGPFTLESASGLPPGMTTTLSGRTIKFSGAPTATGTFAAKITVGDPAGHNETETVTITINAAPTVGTLAAIPWTVGAGSYPQTIAISGGTGPFTVVSSSGLPFSPIVSGNTIRFVGSGGAGTYSNGTIKLRDAAGATVTAHVATIVINPAIFITHMSVNNWTQDTPNFPGAMTITGGTGPFTVVQTRNLPPGLNPVIKGDLIEFTGLPEAAVLANCSIMIRDTAGATYTRDFVLDIAPPLVLTTLRLPLWRSGVQYSTTLQATGGTGNLTFAISAGSLPPGLTLTKNGKLSGKATAVGAFTFTVTVTDSIGDTSSETFTL